MLLRSRPGFDLGRKIYTANTVQAVNPRIPSNWFVVMPLRLIINLDNSSLPYYGAGMTFEFAGDVFNSTAVAAITQDKEEGEVSIYLYCASDPIVYYYEEENVETAHKKAVKAWLDSLKGLTQ
jgi:hypothetical protein